MQKLDFVCEQKVDKNTCQIFGKSNEKDHAENAKEHEEIWSRIHHHKHDKEGKVIVA